MTIQIQERMYQWTDDLSVNNAKIDSLHQEMFEVVNRIMDAMRTGRGTTMVLEVVDFLERYVIDTFSHEESYMKASDYPHYTPHKAEHDAFMKNVSAIRTMVLKGRILIAILLEVQQLTCSWLKNHHMRSDKALGEYSRKTGRKAALSQIQKLDAHPGCKIS